jgi:hypothetical protein
VARAVENMRAAPAKAFRIREREMVLIALFLFIGGVLGLRFKVAILIPTVILTAIVAGSTEIVQRKDAWSSALITLAAVTAVQIGYGIAAYVVANRAVTSSHKALERSELGFIE